MLNFNRKGAKIAAKFASILIISIKKITLKSQFGQNFVPLQR